MRTLRVAGFLLVSAAALTGCGSDAPPAPASSPAAPPSATVSPTSASSPPSSSAPPSSSGIAQPTGPLVAENGTDLKSCRDGDCEVIVKPKDKLAFDARLRVTSLTVDAVSASGVTLSAALPSGGRSTISGGAGQTNGIAYRVTAIKDGKAVLKFTPAT
ncbi:hypothetical protein CFP71_12390 [Amycolatopsis thailandensis]|uniref:Uncharacterized protein n=1 Tax=Amycolatopsis thailandensis TaxID=589330 RepID=A0A229SCH9_9PSEU|nr:hypothetical protein [Amycolatopsis thailandensis]OXM56626.1 hypothetical protein CFP71_12390 [Amycolatopsis thailandensis]